MGSEKSRLLHKEELVGVAAEALVRAGAAKRCCAHHEVLIRQDDHEGERLAYAVGTNMVHNGEVNGTREEFMSAIKTALHEAVDRCGICEAAFAKD